MTRDELERRLGRAISHATTGTKSLATDPDIVAMVEAAMAAVDEHVAHRVEEGRRLDRLFPERRAES